jgi:hypothetical protein
MCRVLLFILFFTSATYVRSQIVDTAFIYRWLQHDNSFNKDSVDCYFITEQDTAYDFAYSRTLYYKDEFNKFLDHLTRLRIDRIENISYSNKINIPDFVAGRTLFVSTIIKQDKRDVKALLKEANRKFREKSPEKYPVLIIDNKCIDLHNSKKAISSLKSNDIYFIAVTSSLPPNLHCQKDDNGIVQVWMKKKYK